jgi:hypothetical protein
MICRNIVGGKIAFYPQPVLALVSLGIKRPQRDAGQQLQPSTEVYNVCNVSTWGYNFIFEDKKWHSQDTHATVTFISEFDIFWPDLQRN